MTDPFDAVDTASSEASNGKSQDSGRGLTRLTDLTAIEMGVHVPGAHARPRPRSRALLSTPLTTAVKSVKSVKPQDGKGVFSPPCRQTGCQFDGSVASGVVA